VRNMNPEKAEGLSPELQRATEPLLAGIESLSERIREYDERIEELAQKSYPQVVSAHPAGARSAAHTGPVWRRQRSAALGFEVSRARWKERQETSHHRHGAKAGGAAASFVGERRSV
jgi:hypothetical protein